MRVVSDSSFGIIPLQKNEDVWHVLLIQQHQGFWSFPKGHAEKNETPLESATRELKEETALNVEKLLSKVPVIERYSFLENKTKIDKTVYYFVALVRGDLILQQEEILQAKWVSLEMAKEHLTYDESKATLKQVIEILSKIESKIEKEG